MPVVLPFPKERTLYLSAQVDQASMNALTKAIIDINESDEELNRLAHVYGMTYTPSPIRILIDSYGGAVYQCYGLVGVMERSATTIHTIVTGCAMSCGFVIAISGHVRSAYDKATFLYHQVSNGFHGTAKDMADDLAEVERLQKIMEKHVLRRTKITKKQLQVVYEGKKDWTITPKQALKLGVIDEIR